MVVFSASLVDLLSIHGQLISIIATFLFFLFVVVVVVVVVVVFFFFFIYLCAVWSARGAESEAATMSVLKDRAF